MYRKNNVDHQQNLENLFKRLHQFGFKVKAPKCIIGQNIVSFFGVILSDKGKHPDPEKIEALKESTSSENKGELQ